MTRPRAERVALAVAAAIAVVTVSGLVLLRLNRHVIYGNDVFLFGLFTATTLAYTAAGLAIVRRAPVHVIGWLCLGTGFVLELGITLTQYGLFAIRTRPGSLPAPALGLVAASQTPLLTLTGIVLIAHLFPTGWPVGPRWRWPVAASVAGQTIALVLTFFLTDRITDVWSDELSHAGVSAANPLAIGGGGIGWLNVVGVLLFVAGAVGAVVSLFVRRRRATSDERRQIRWLAAVGGAALGWIVLMLPIMLLAGPNGPAGAVFWIVITPLVALGPPVAIGIGIVKYRALDIDVVIRKTVVVAVVGFALTVLYLGVIALATVPGAPRLLVGAVLLAVTFNPVRRAARSIADRVAYGKRASAYEVLAHFSERMAETYAADDVLPRMATILASGTAAASATVWLRIGDELRPAASAGGEQRAPGPVRIDGDSLPRLGGGEAVEVRHHGELLGALSLTMPANDPLDPSRRQLVQDMASQAGLVLRNVRLIEELRASRARLVAAQDEERRRLERNIHDGAQQQLVALSVKLRLAQQMAERDPAATRELLEQLQTDSATALEDLRDLARGSTRRCWPIRGSPPRSTPRHARRRYPPPWRPTG